MFSNPNTTTASAGTTNIRFAPSHDTRTSASALKPRPIAKAKPIIRSKAFPGPKRQQQQQGYIIGPGSEVKWAGPDNPFATSASKVNVHVQGFVGGMARTSGSIVNSADRFMVEADGDVVMSDRFVVDADGDVVMSDPRGLPIKTLR
jgi:hypothetical protein